jgi:hypothetical protein
MPMSPTEAVSNVASNAIGAMKSTPLAVALLMVNIAFLGFSAYILREVSHNSAERNKVQLELINTLVKDCRRTKDG